MKNILSRWHVLLAFVLLGTGIAPVAAAPTKLESPQQLRIGFQKSAVNLVLLKQRGVLEQRFKDVKVSWVEFPAGPQLLEALALGSLDFGLTGDTPPVFAQAAGKEIAYAGAEPPKPDSSALLVPNGSSITDVAQLKGKRIALQKGSSAHYLVVRALEKSGLRWSDIEPIYLTPAEARAAFERGSVDAWAIWDPYYAAAELAIKPRVLTSGRSLSNNNSFYLTSRSFAEHYPQVLVTLLEELSNAATFAQKNHREAVKVIAEFSGLDGETVDLFLTRRPFSPASPLAAKTITDQQTLADTFHRLGLIPRSITVASVVWQPGKQHVAQVTH